MRHRAALVIATLALSSRALSQVVPTAPAPDSVERLLASIRAGYDSGFSQLVAALPTTARDRSTKLWLLWQLGQFRTQAVAWARLDGNRYLSVSQGPLMPAWLVVVPPGSEAFRRMRGTLQLDPTATILVAQMAPEPVTPTWAGVFLMHQLSLLASYVQGDTVGESAAARIELQANYIELVAGDFVAQGRLRGAIDTIFARWEPQSPNEAVRRITNADRSLFLTLQAAVSREAPRSTAEAELRGGFAVVAMVVRYCERHSLPANQCAALLKQIPSRL